MGPQSAVGDADPDLLDRDEPVVTRVSRLDGGLEASIQDGRLRVAVAAVPTVAVPNDLDATVTPVRDSTVVESALEHLFVQDTRDGGEGGA